MCSQIVLKCLYLARIGRPDNPWSANKLCPISHMMDSSLWQTFGQINFIHSFITQMTTVYIVMWETQHSIVDQGSFKTQTLLEIEKIRNQQLEEFYVSLVLAHLCLHSSTESEIISLDAVNRTPSHSIFSHALYTRVHTTLWLKVLQRVSHAKHVHPHVIMCLIVPMSLFALNSSSLSCVSTFCPLSTSPISRS